jgi:hypothetical protein
MSSSKDPESEPSKSDLLQRHPWVVAWLFAAFAALWVGGTSGFIGALLAGVILFVFLALLGALLATMIESPAQLPVSDDKTLPEQGAASPAPNAPSNSFYRRYLRNLRRAAQEGPRFWG